MCKTCWGLFGLSVAALAALGYIMVVRGNVTASADGRTAIILEAGERDLVLAEMRGFLESVQGIVAATTKNDMTGASAMAKKAGSAAANEVPVTLMAKLPLEFKTLGLATHSAFDAVALEADGLGNKDVVLEKLSDLMLNCTSCHAGYRLTAEAAKP